jgi:NADPH2:quinone reductase
MREYILHKHGATDVLKFEKIKDEPHPRENEVLIEQKAIGVNFNDILFRRGNYKINKLPAILGTDGCGIVSEVGKKVKEFKEGDRVAYATSVLGGYSKKRVVHKNCLVAVPSGIDDVTVAGSLTKGLMAHTSLHRAYDASRVKRILVHAAAGGVGQFISYWASHMGIEVIGTVGSDDKIIQAKAAGCHHVINYQKEDFVKSVANITKGSGVGIVYDGVGKDTILKSIDCLWPMGMCISYGESSGPIPPIDINRLLYNSLYITRINLHLYKSNRIELALSAHEVFQRIKKRIIKPQITTFKFSQLREAHKLLESRKSTGSIVLDLSKQ